MNRLSAAHSPEPVRIPLTFSHPYAFRGAYLIADFDETVRALLTARHVGLMSTRESERLLDRAARAVRRAYLSPVGYEYLGITREDVAQGTARAQQAKEVMGELPAAILSSEQRAPYAPESQGGFRALNVHRPQRVAPAGATAADDRPSPAEAEPPAGADPGADDAAGG